MESLCLIALGIAPTFWTVVPCVRIRGGFDNFFVYVKEVDDLIVDTNFFW